MIDFLQNIDAQLLLLINSFHMPYADRFMMLFTGRFEWVPMYAALLFVVLRGFGWRKGLMATGCIILSIVFADQLCAHVIRPVAERLRPANAANPLSEFIHIVNGYRGGMYGFPSCHAANSFALATIVTLLLRNRRVGWFIFLWAALNSYSRLYLGVHYPGDIICGAIIGALCGAVCYGIASMLRLNHKFVNLQTVLGLRLTDLLILSGVAIVLGIAIAAIA